MISNIGCQPYWLNFVQTDMENCSEASQMDKFLESMGNLNAISSEEELAENYNCLKPCTFMEYKVRTFFKCIFAAFRNHTQKY